MHEILTFIIIKFKAPIIGAIAGLMYELFMSFVARTKEFRWIDLFVAIIISSFVGWGAGEALADSDASESMKNVWIAVVSLKSFVIISVITSKELTKALVKRYFPHFYDDKK